MSVAKPIRFPFYLRVPAWCQRPEVQINGESRAVEAGPPSYLAIDRTWNDGDVIRLRLPMKVAVRKWAKNHDSVSINYGPLTFSLAIGERWSRYGGHDKWPQHEGFAPK